MPKKLDFTKHAADRMVERNVEPSEVEDVIRSPEICTPGKGGKTNLWKTVGGRRLRVTILETSTKIKVITVVSPDEEA